MKADRFFSVSYDIRNHPKIKLLMMLENGYEGFGRWVALMSILYDLDGVIDISNDTKKRYLASELQTDDLDSFLKHCSECGLIDAGLLEIGHVASKGICDQLEYYKAKSEAGKKGNEKRWGKDGKGAKAKS